MRFSRQEYWTGLPFSPPGDLLDPGVNPASLSSAALVGRLFTTSATREVHIYVWLGHFAVQQMREETGRAGLHPRPGCELWAAHTVTLPVDSELCARRL